MILQRIIYGLLVLLCVSCSNQQQNNQTGKQPANSLLRLADETSGSPAANARENMLDRDFRFLAIIDETRTAVIPGANENINKLVVRQLGYPYSYRTLSPIGRELTDPQEIDIARNAYKYAATYNDTIMSLMRQQPLSSDTHNIIELPEK